MYSFIYLFCHYFWGFMPLFDRIAGELTGKGMTCSRGPQVGFEPSATAATTQPLSTWAPIHKNSMIKILTL